MKFFVLLVATGLLASCASTPDPANGVTAPLRNHLYQATQDPWQPIRPMCKDPARHISVCVKALGRSPERSCSCMSVNEVARTGLLSTGPRSMD